MVIEQAYINLLIMMSPLWLMLVYIIVEELVDCLAKRRYNKHINSKKESECFISLLKVLV